MKIKNEKIKIMLISLGVLVAVSTPAIIVASTYAYQSFLVSGQLSNSISKLESFYNDKKILLFTGTNFKITEPQKADNGKFYAKNLTKDNIIFEKINYLKNFSYDFEFVKINQNIDGSFTFDYIIYSVANPSVKIEKTSDIYYSFVNDLGTSIPFDKIKEL